MGLGGGAFCLLFSVLVGVSVLFLFRKDEANAGEKLKQFARTIAAGSAAVVAAALITVFSIKLEVQWPVLPMMLLGLAACIATAFRLGNIADISRPGRGRLGVLWFCVVLFLISVFFFAAKTVVLGTG